MMANAETLLAYSANWAKFTQYCARYGIDPLEPRPGDMIEFIDECHLNCRKRATALKLKASIAHQFSQIGRPSPFVHPAVAAAWKSLWKSLSQTQKSKRTISLEQLENMTASTSVSIVGIRDRAILWVGWMTGIGCKMARLRAVDVVRVQRGFLISGKWLLPAGSEPWRAMSDWMGECRLSCGDGSDPVFRPIKKGGKIEVRPISPQSIRNIVKGCVELIGLDPAEFGANSLKASVEDALRLRRRMVKAA